MRGSSREVTRENILRRYNPDLNNHHSFKVIISVGEMLVTVTEPLNQDSIVQVQLTLTEKLKTA